MIRISRILLLTVFAGLSLLQASTPWYGFEEGIEKARVEKKPVIIDFYTDWCKWCKVMDQKTFSVPEVDKYLFENFVPIRINAESPEPVSFRGNDYNYMTLTRAFGVNSYPSLAYMDDAGELLTVMPGYIEKDEFLRILEYISRKLYQQNINFQEYIETGKP